MNFYHGFQYNHFTRDAYA